MSLRRHLENLVEIIALVLKVHFTEYQVFAVGREL